MPLFIKDYPKDELVELLKKMGEPRFRATQLFKWLYQKGITDFTKMTDISKLSQRKFDATFESTSVAIETRETSRDGTTKYLYRLTDGKAIEGVLIPDPPRLTLCVSTQVGCRMGCAFCKTARMGLIRNLRTGEIVDQVCQVQAAIGPKRKITNLVFMGMGEPLDNLENALKAIEILGASDGFQFSHRRLTVSTCGLVNQLESLGDKTKRFRLAVSLNAADNETRNRLMPVNRKYPIERLLAACQAISLRNRERVTFEYVMLKGVNDREQDAKALVRLFRGFKVKINLIPFNETEGIPFKRPAEKAILRFQEILVNANMTAIIRSSRGDDISAACGQLATATATPQAVSDPPVAAPE
ncbi:MAG: 23S rRNA (adenine(2503)-C(2))-methyltransferase RlmN [Deltaproteobacteria bacterium]|nr:MAG: 23S rRNA (adenine(2503)-C(2))-methyltransferase RlmN [Deltaproteobacteria bacterium]